MNRVSVKPEWLPITVIVCEEGVLHVRQSCAVVDRARAICGITNGTRQSKMVENLAKKTLTARDP